MRIKSRAMGTELNWQDYQDIQSGTGQPDSTVAAPTLAGTCASAARLFWAINRGDRPGARSCNDEKGDALVYLFVRVCGDSTGTCVKRTASHFKITK